MKRMLFAFVLFCGIHLSTAHFWFGGATLSCMFFSAGLPAMGQSVDRGFRHPGGLHTQADFDRVRQQIAEGNTKVKQAFAKLKASAYAQPGVQTYPVETIVRGGGSGENYINAARGAAMAYQNALRWKLEDNRSCANAAVRILMTWANTTKQVSGNSDQKLAVGLYGYQFAQAAELMRDYEGWSQSDFETFKRWMLDVWYAPCIDFLRARNGTWENSGKWWQAPGHYWSNWGLCNILCCISIGILCDDVFIYNQGMSFFKYDQVGTFLETRTDVPIKNDGLTDFLGNLVVTTYPFEQETGAYGLVGQMNESGRDTGHSAMALGLAVDIAKVGWNQGDDLFAYMNHRLAAGIEYVAAQTQNVEGLPWVNYQYGTNGYYYTDYRAYIIEGPALGAQNRPYWGTVIGVYEGVKGIRMPFAEKAYTAMGIDEGGMGSTSGGYDHLGFSVLMNTRDEQLCPADRVPTELTPRMEYSGTLSANLIPSLSQERTRRLIEGKTVCHNELGGLVNTFTSNLNTTLPQGQTIRLVPQLPEGEEDTGRWQWESGETSRELTIPTDVSHIYRVHYTNALGAESELAFAIASKSDCTPTPLQPSLTVSSGNVLSSTEAEVLYGKTATLSVSAACGWGSYKWSDNSGAQTLTVTVNADRDVSVTYTNQGGAETSQTFHLRMLPAIPYVSTGGIQTSSTEVIVNSDGDAILGLTLPTAVRATNVQWSTGQTGASIEMSHLQTSQHVTATFTLRGQEYSIGFDVLVRDAEASRIIPAGNYVLRHVASGNLLTAQGKNASVAFTPAAGPEGQPAETQQWYLQPKDEATAKYNFVSLADADSLKLTTLARTSASAYFPFSLLGASGTQRYALYTGTGTSARYWDVDAQGAPITSASSSLTAFPFELIPLEETVGLDALPQSTVPAILRESAFDLSGRPVLRPRPRTPYIFQGKTYVRP